MKKVEVIIKLQCKGGEATPAPPIGPALGSKGVNIMEFCKQFNAATRDMEPEMPVPVVITAFSDRSFVFEMRTPPASYFLRKAAGIAKGLSTPGKGSAGSVSMRVMHDRRGLPLISQLHDPHLPALQFHRHARSGAWVACTWCTASRTTMPSPASAW